MKLPFLCLLLLLLFSITVAESQPYLPQNEIESYTKVGQKMPSFTVNTLEGTKVSTDDLKGKVLLVNFWATWCPPCQFEMPRLEKEVWQKFKSDDFLMVAVAREQTEQEIGAFRKARGYSFPMAADVNREVYKLFGNGGIPRSYVVNEDGKILFQSVGYTPAEFDQMTKVLEKELERVRKEKQH